MEQLDLNCKPQRRVFSRIGLALSVILLASTVFQLLWVLVPRAIWGEEHWMIASSWGVWLGTFLPIYAIAVPIGLFMMKKLPAQAPADRKLSVKGFFVLLLVSYCLMYAGNLIGTGLSEWLSGGQAENTVAEYAMDTSPLKVVVMVILAPVIEEYIFRKQIIDRTARYGEKLAVVLSALTFGLFHGNLFQFFYAFGLGLVFAYIYVRTGRLRYSVLMHGIINFMGAVIAPWVLSMVDLDVLLTVDPNMDPEALMALYGQLMPGLAIYLGYAFALVALALTGLIQILLYYKKLVWQPAAQQLPKGSAFRTVYLNVGMILLVVLCILSTVLALF